MFIFLLFFYFVFIYPLIEIDNYYRQREYENNKRVFVENMLRLQELNRKMVIEELKTDLTGIKEALTEIPTIMDKS